MDIPNMTKEELLALRDELITLVEHLRKLGDFDANAGAVRVCAETLLKLTQHLVDRMKRA